MLAGDRRPLTYLGLTKISHIALWLKASATRQNSSLDMHEFTLISVRIRNSFPSTRPPSQHFIALLDEFHRSLNGCLSPMESQYSEDSDARTSML